MTTSHQKPIAVVNVAKADKNIDIDATGLSDIAGKYESDPTLQDICNEAYRQRDETIEQ